MGPFKEVLMDPRLILPKTYMDAYHVSIEEAWVMVATSMRQLYYVNEVYSVTISPPMDTEGGWWPRVHKLSVMRNDKQPIHSWSDMQYIKNTLLGPEHEAIEVFPAESRLVDMGPQYHLWVFESPQVRVPIGWTKRMVRGEKV